MRIDIQAGIILVEAVAAQLKIPVKLITAPIQLYDEIKGRYPILA
jgi:hypothetical protein